MSILTKKYYNLEDVPEIALGLKTLRRDHPAFSSVEIGHWPTYPQGFEGLARIVTGQQVSTAAADSIWKKLQVCLGDVTPARYLSLSEEALRACGLSGQKYRYIFALAQDIDDGTFDPAALADADDDTVYEKITARKGFGRWSAEMYLIFCLNRPDIWPAGDLGVREGVKQFSNLEHRPDEKTALFFGEAFAPYRTAASLLLWEFL